MAEDLLVIVEVKPFMLQSLRDFVCILIAINYAKSEKNNYSMNRHIIVKMKVFRVQTGSGRLEGTVT